MWKILIHMCSNEEMEMLYISERGGMEEDKNRHDLSTGHDEFAVPLLL